MAWQFNSFFSVFACFDPDFEPAAHYDTPYLSNRWPRVRNKSQCVHLLRARHQGLHWLRVTSCWYRCASWCERTVAWQSTLKAILFFPEELQWVSGLQKDRRSDSDNAGAVRCSESIVSMTPKHRTNVGNTWKYNVWGRWAHWRVFFGLYLFPRFAWPSVGPNAKQLSGAVLTEFTVLASG